MLEGKVALITGANGGLGQAVTRAFLEAGANVIGVARSIQDSEFPHPAFAAMRAEITSGEAARAVADAVAARFGRIDVLVHLIGGFAGGQPVAETDDATLERMLDLNLKSAFYMIRAVVPQMRRQGGGRILAIGSRAAAEPAPRAGAYAASKAALVALVRAVAKENKDCAITANIVLPATIDTPANRAADPKADFTRWVDPAQIAALLVHLASEAAAQVSGAAIPVYGRDL
jgi:NAD(P)-dependent dehydrogenase (short-subunit alcohol dehydrogenase family)